MAAVCNYPGPDITSRLREGDGIAAISVHCFLGARHIWDRVIGR
ncbi:hypothetical protein [Mycobacterium sp. E2479]|nr:hypothetical protein [Mycobacterium sp. E2479]